MDGKLADSKLLASPPLTVAAKVAVLLPASGSSSRFSSSVSGAPCSTPAMPAAVNGTCSWTKLKQYQTVGEERTPILIHTITAFANIPWISNIVLMVQEHLVQCTQALLQAHLNDNCLLSSGRVTIRAGSETRHRTIQGGVHEISSWTDKPAVVIVHDVVRPLIDEATCLKVVGAASQYGAAGVYVPLVSTILRIDSEGMMSEALPRHDLFSSEMPQCFRLSVLEDAYRSASEEELTNGTECLALAKKYSKCQVKMIPVDPNRYFKVTYERDLLTVNAMVVKDRRSF
ncbi:hypothetical protein RvY_01663 [Ramazzottius varieornatus]|uniref:2-C-methyl-D-erythritol 4-phosphate cytidylyltransferase-like protein n=1 Tax=Ramazzottius varieornatus TaxID=947166 RepID=A0A1D1USB5_RAMVA|nr:hypothetical protein RvY_01663 [Ramazzottius varieornatus]